MTQATIENIAADRDPSLAATPAPNAAGGQGRQRAGRRRLVIARALEGKSHRPYVFTKCGMVWDEQRRIGHSLKAESIRRECEASLRRLRAATTSAGKRTRRTASGSSAPPSTPASTSWTTAG